MSRAIGMNISSLAVDAGRIVRSARLAIGWTQRELGRRSGIAQTAISRLERGLPSALDLDAIQRIATALGGTIRLMFEAPFLMDRARQRDRVTCEVRCICRGSSTTRRVDGRDRGRD